MKRRLLLLFGVVAILAILSAGTLAYFTAQTKATNIISSGSVNLKIHERTADGSNFPKEGVMVMPGDTVSKVVTVENVGSAPLYLRVRLTKRVNDASLAADDCISMNLNTLCWTEKDGYYYFNEALNPGQTTEALFSEVYVDLLKVDNAYLGKYFTLEVSAYGVQAAYNGNTPWDAVGWPEEEVAK